MSKASRKCELYLKYVRCVVLFISFFAYLEVSLFREKRAGVSLILSFSLVCTSSYGGPDCTGNVGNYRNGALWSNEINVE